MIRRSILLLLLLLIPFQNCSTKFRAPASLQDPNNRNGAPLTQDPLLVGKTLSGSAYTRDRYTDNAIPSSVDIQALDNTGYLSNGHLSITFDSQFPSQVAQSSTNFSYGPSTPQFRQTNAYYHAIRLIALYKKLNFDLSTLVNILLDTHCEAPSNAYFNSVQNRVCLGYVDLNPRRFAADDSDVMIHELNHAINRVLNTNDILQSSPEMGAVDEGTSDFWSNMLNNSPDLAPYYGRAIWEGAYKTPVNEPLRTANANPLPRYPESLTSEVHEDGVVFNSALWAIYAAVPSSQHESLQKAVARTIQDAQDRDGFKQLAYKFGLEASSLGMDMTVVQNKLTSFGLRRTDDLNQLSVPTSGAVRVIDQTIQGVISVSNCNKILEQGEEALVFINFNNAGAALGSIEAQVLSVGPGLQVYAGGDYGFFMRFSANKSFLNSIPTTGSLSSLDSYRYGALVYSTFLIKANSAGTYNMTVRLKSFSSITGATQTRDFTVPVTVAAASATKTCSAGQNPWP